MTILKNTVLLLKSEKSDEHFDRFEEILRTKNFEVMFVKTLSFRYENLDLLKEELLNPDKYSGIILSSPRCVNAVSQSLDKAKIETWCTKFNFVVGETTFKDAQTKLGIVCEGKESGNAKNLSQIIIQNKSKYKKPFLFPHGNLKTDVLRTELGTQGLQLHEVLVYHTLSNPDIEKELAECTRQFTDLPEFLVFFSPSGFHSTVDYLKRFPDLKSTKLVAIGPVTQLALEEENLTVYSVAQSPTPQELVKALLM